MAGSGFRVRAWGLGQGFRAMLWSRCIQLVIGDNEGNGHGLSKNEDNGFKGFSKAIHQGGSRHAMILRGTLSSQEHSSWSNASSHRSGVGECTSSSTCALGLRLECEDAPQPMKNLFHPTPTYSSQLRPRIFICLQHSHTAISSSGRPHVKLNLS